VKNLAPKFRILLLGTQMSIGGAQKVLLDQADWFHQQGHQVFAAFIYDKENLRDRWQAESNVPIIDLKAHQKDGNFFVNGILLVRGLFSLWRLIRREKIQVIETFTHDSNMLALPVAWLAGVPVRIATHHGVIENFPRWRETIHTWMVNHNIAQSLVVVSSRIKQQAILEGVAAKRISVIQNGITPISIEGVDKSTVRKEAGLKDEDLFLLSVGRLVYQKAHAILIQAMPQILEKYPNLKLGICGDGGLRSQLEIQIKESGLSNSVKLIGVQDHIEHFLAVADIFVLPSRWEGLPIALLEAMSAGLPVAATRVEGVDEVVRDGEDGYLVNPEDSNELATAILKLLARPNLRLEMGAAARRHVTENYDNHTMCDKYLQLMIELMATGG
jgi:glycosyltransferase involved in cell wall biosynthesis